MQPQSSETSDASLKLKEISVEEYFEQKYNIKLKYPYLPCIDARSGPTQRANYLPMEVVKVVEWQRALKPLDTVQRARTTSKSVIKPNQRYEEIMNIMNSRDFVRDPYLKQLNIGVMKQEMLQIKARILDPPQIRFRQGQGQNEMVEFVNVGKWRIGRNRFYRTPEIRNWGLIYYGPPPKNQMNQIINEFANQLPELLRRKGFIIPQHLKLIPVIETSDIETQLTEASRKGWQLAIVILNMDDNQSYNEIKRIGHQKIGLRTQCVDWQTLCENINKLYMYVENLSQKINVKLGGINSIVSTKLALTRSTQQDLFMFFGADVTHSTSSTDRPSVAAVVASREPTNSLYTARLCEQYPKKGRCSIEIIKELDRMVEDLLRVFAGTSNGHLPNKIVFYRDGVDEGHFEKVLGNEVNKIKEACRRVYGNCPLPLLTFIVVKKRHNTRFFLYENNQTLNVPPGTVIDQDITHPSQFDFYLCSQTALTGTARPTLYHILHDDNHFSSDDIQQLTYWLCHTDMRCTKSVSIPAPVYYAHLAAYGSRSLDFDANHPTESNENNNNDNEDVDDEDDPTSYSLEDIKTKVMMFNPKVANDMWLI